MKAECLVLAAVLLLIAPHADAQSGNIRRIEPPQYGFFTKQVDCRGIIIKSSDGTTDSALRIACDRLQMMLQYLPNVTANLDKLGAELHIIGSNEVTSDLPEHRFRKGKEFQGHPDEPISDFDRRTRGVGGIYASCGEENLLKLVPDRYYGRDICVHEFAHTIFEDGLDDAAQAIITRAYNDALARNLWRDKYAHENASEFFAELSMWYFGTHGDDPHGDIGIGPDALKKYDSASFAVIDSVYRGKLPVRLLDLDTLPSWTLNEARLGSGNSREPCDVLFRNMTPRQVRVLWVMQDGARKLYKVMNPFESFVQPTYKTHVWLIEEMDGTARQQFRADGKFGLALIK